MKTTINYQDIQGKKIFSVLEEPEVPNKTIIMSHGFRGNSIGPSRSFVDLNHILLENGYSVLRFDQPNCGNSEGDFLDTSFHERIRVTTHLANEYREKGYTVGLLGHSMGATVSIITAVQEELQNKIACLLLWAPGIADIEKYHIDSDTIYEEAGQQYKSIFWNEERTYDMLACMRKYNGRIHLVFGETDKYTHQELREQLIDLVKEKSGSVMILKGQDHSSWNYDSAQEVYREELEFIKRD